MKDLDVPVPEGEILAISQIGGGDFTAIGKLWFNILLKHGLKPTDNVLDIGCGLGRMAVPLTTFLKKSSIFEGLDIVPESISWCQQEITSRYSNFGFKHFDIYNKQYNPNGAMLADHLLFPYEDDMFDMVFLTSVFTHMYAPDIKNYLGEIKRVLRPGKKCLATFFILNEQSKKNTEDGKSRIDFKFKLDNCYTANINVPEKALGFDEQTVLNIYKDLDIDIIDSIQYGGWSDKSSSAFFQDIIISTHS